MGGKMEIRAAASKVWKDRIELTTLVNLKIPLPGIY